MKRLALAGALCAALLAQACAETTQETAEAPGAAAPAPSVEGGAMTDGAMAPNSADGAQAFLATMAASDQLEIEASRVALEKTKTAAVREFAQRMIEEHGGTTKSLTELARNAGMTMPAAALDANGQTLVENLRAAEVEGFDDRYLDTVIDAHERTIERVETYASEGENAELKAWASRTLPTLRAHLQTAETVRKTVNAS